MTARALANQAVAGLILAAVCIVMSQSLGALIFAGKIAGAVHLGTHAALLTAWIAGLIIAWRSSSPGTIATPQERIAPVLVLLTQSIVTRLPEDAPAPRIALTVLAALVVTSLVVGIALYGLGRLQLGNLTRYLPYPVMGGFLAGSGWLLVLGAIRVTTGFSFSSLASFRVFLDPITLAQAASSVVLGTALFTLIRLRPQPLLFAACLMGAVPLFFGILAVTGVPTSMARGYGWLSPLVTSDVAFPSLWSVEGLRAIEWSLLPGTAGIVGSALLTSALSVLFNSSGIELLKRSEIDINRELRTAGLANLACGACGGIVGFQSLNLTRLGHDLGARGRFPVAFAALLCAAAWLAGPAPAAYIPRFVLGGILFSLGLGFLHDWVIRAHRRLPRGDYAVVLLILAVIGTLGYVQGVAVGLMAALLLFVHKYARVSVVTHALTAADHPSNVDRPQTQRKILADRGSEVLVLRLQGFLFFGTANSLVTQIRNRAQSPDEPRLRHVVLDFHRVSGLDSSAAFSLARALQLAEKHGFELILTHLDPQIRRQLGGDAFREDQGRSHRILPTLDHGIEWCEESMLAVTEPGPEPTIPPLREALDGGWPGSGTLEPFLSRLQRLEIPAGTHLIRQGSPSDALYFLENGQVTTVLESEAGVRRLRRQGPGTILGELGLLLGVPRTASVVTDTPCIVYRLNAADLETMKKEQPALAAQFFEFVSVLLAERVVHGNRVIRAFMD